MRSFTIIQDNREKKPLPFPKRIAVLDEGWPTHLKTQIHDLVVVRKTIPEADYLIEAAEGIICPSVFGGLRACPSVIIERKASLLELSANLLRSRHRRERFREILSLMRASWTYPILMVEGGLSTLYNPPLKWDLSVPPSAAVDALLRISCEQGVPVVPIQSGTGKSRLQLGEHIARTLINGTLTHGFRTQGSGPQQPD